MFDRRVQLGQVRVSGKMGQVSGPTGGQGQGTGGMPGTSISVAHSFTPSSPLSFTDFRDFGFYPPYYNNYPVYTPPPPPAPARLICRKLEKESEDAGSDVFECSQQPAYQQYPAYPGFSAYPVTYVRPYRRWY